MSKVACCLTATLFAVANISCFLGCGKENNGSVLVKPPLTESANPDKQNLRFANETFERLSRSGIKLSGSYCNEVFQIRGIDQNEPFAFTVNCADLSGGVALLVKFTPGESGSVNFESTLYDSSGKTLEEAIVSVNPLDDDDGLIELLDFEQEVICELVFAPVEQTWQGMEVEATNRKSGEG